MSLKFAKAAFRKEGVVHTGCIVNYYVRFLCNPTKFHGRSFVLYTDDPVDCMNCLVKEARRL